MVEKQFRLINKRIPVIVLKQQMLFVGKCLSCQLISIAKC